LSAPNDGVEDGQQLARDSDESDQLGLASARCATWMDASGAGAPGSGVSVMEGASEVSWPPHDAACGWGWAWPPRAASR
jgi:hypothetical protein